MKRTIELLKKVGIIDKFDNVFNTLKPHQGMSDERILNIIKNCLISDLYGNEQFEIDFFEAMMMDASEAIKNELHIEYVTIEEAKANVAIKLREIFGTDSDTRKE